MSTQNIKNSSKKKTPNCHSGCCTIEETTIAHDHHDHEHTHEVSRNLFRLFLPAIISFVLLMIGITLDYVAKAEWFSSWFRFAWYFAAYIPVGFPVLRDAYLNIRAGNFFSEFFLMGIATIGAFALKEYPEAVAVMLFYTVGENFQAMAVTRARKNIQTLLDQRPDEATILVDNQPKIVNAKDVKIGDIIQLKPGEKLALDGKLLSEKANFNTSALTGESLPEQKTQNEVVLAGMINLNSLALIEVTTAFEDSKLSRILHLVQNASSQKAPTELFIAKFARVYTPIVVYLAIAITFLPYFFVDQYDFGTWLYRALVFLVISCPCALVISIPLGYFGGIGAASKHGILFKGGSYIDLLANIQHVAMDKTGTLTEGIFKVQEVNLTSTENKEKILQHINLIESKSTHPIATAIHEYAGKVDETIRLESSEEIPGKGLKAKIDDDWYLVGNFRLLDQFSVQYPKELMQTTLTTLAIAKNEKFIGYITIADQIKSDAQQTIDELHSLDIETTMLSGDKDAVVQEVAKTLGIDEAYGDLLPENKLEKIKTIKAKNQTVAFVGDGVNDAPVVAISDVGMAMGGLGSDATIETADVVIQDDQPKKIPMAIRISKETKKIVWQNIGLAFGVKALVLILGAGGIATMWEAVFADVGVALLAILNAVRIQNKDFNH